MTKRHDNASPTFAELRRDRELLRQAVIAIRAKVHANASGKFPSSVRRSVRAICDSALQGRDTTEELASSVEDVERVARHLCRVRGIDPDHVITNPFSDAVVGSQWQQWIKMAESYIKTAEFVSIALTREMNA